MEQLFSCFIHVSAEETPSYTAHSQSWRGSGETESIDSAGRGMRRGGGRRRQHPVDERVQVCGLLKGCRGDAEHDDLPEKEEA